MTREIIMLRYGIAMIVAALIILAGVWFVSRTNAELNTAFEQQRQRLKQQKADGTLPDSLKDVDLDALKLDNVGMQVSRGMKARLDWAGGLEHFWYVLVPLTVALCLGVAYLLGKVRSTQS